MLNNVVNFIQLIAPFVGYGFMLVSTAIIGWIVLEFAIEGIISSSSHLSKRVEELRLHGTYWRSFERYFMLRFRHVWRDKINAAKKNRVKSRE